MKILNFGSLNIDHVYQVDHFVRAGETLASSGYARHMGGKGFNQSIALARAGAAVYHAGCMGEDGDFMRAYLHEAGVNVAFLRTVDGPTGHAMIQVEPSGENCILLFGGANQRIEAAQIRETLAHFAAGDILLLQNEINGLPFLMKYAHEKGMQIALNPSPIDGGLFSLPLDTVRWFLLNEIEGEALTGVKEPKRICQKLLENYPNAEMILTLGSEGVCYQSKDQKLVHPSYRVPVVDTTAAGDTFTGYFLAKISAGESVSYALECASKAAALAVSQEGAAPSIPTIEEVQRFDFPARE